MAFLPDAVNQRTSVLNSLLAGAGSDPAAIQNAMAYYTAMIDSPFYRNNIASIGDNYNATKAGSPTGLSNQPAGMDPKTQQLWNEYMNLRNAGATGSVAPGSYPGVGGSGVTQLPQVINGGGSAPISSTSLAAQKAYNDQLRSREAGLTGPTGPMINTGATGGVTPLPQIRQSPVGYTSTGATGNIAGTYRPSGTAGTYAPGGSGGSGYAPGTSYRAGLNPGKASSNITTTPRAPAAPQTNTQQIAYNLAKKKAETAKQPYTSPSKMRTY
jgi:hypothetical protein